VGTRRQGGINACQLVRCRFSVRYSYSVCYSCDAVVVVPLVVVVNEEVHFSAHFGTTNQCYRTAGVILSARMGSHGDCVGNMLALVLQCGVATLLFAGLPCKWLLTTCCWYCRFSRCLPCAALAKTIMLIISVSPR